MEDLWKINDLSFRLGDWVERAAYASLRRAFQEEERRENNRPLLFGGALPEKEEPCRG